MRFVVMLALALTACSDSAGPAGPYEPTPPAPVEYTGTGPTVVEVRWPAGSGAVFADIVASGSVRVLVLDASNNELGARWLAFGPTYEGSLFVPAAARYLRVTNVNAQTTWTITLRRGGS